jgi:DEAD/DEAH box helicase domain-containing protein
MIMSKAGAEVILKSLIGMEIDVDALPMGEEEAVPAGIETVVLATEVMGKNGRRVLDKEYEYRDGKVVKIEKDDDDMIVIKDEPQD